MFDLFGRLVFYSIYYANIVYERQTDHEREIDLRWTFHVRSKTATHQVAVSSDTLMLP